MTERANLTTDEFAQIVIAVADLEAEIVRLTSENEALRVRVRDLEFTIGWRDRHGVTRVFDQDGGGLA